MESQVTAPVRRPENDLQESVLFVSHAWHGNRSEVHRLSSRRLYAMSHLNSPEFLKFKIPQRKKRGGGSVGKDTYGNEAIGALSAYWFLHCKTNLISYIP